MRAVLLLPIAALAACSDGGSQNKAAGEAASLETLALAPGQWTVARETLRVEALDKGKPKIAAKVGETSEGNVCIPAGGSANPPPALFTPLNDECTAQTDYVARGRLNLAYSCKRAGLDTPYQVTTDGTYTADGFAATASLGTRLASDGDVRITTRLTGRRTGDCASEEEK